MTDFIAKRITRTYTQNLMAAPAKVFPLLCPTREYDWIETWQCDLVFSASGVAEDNCIFITDTPAHGGQDVWVVCHYEPDREIQFVRVNSIRVIRYSITLLDTGHDTTTAIWTQIITALNESGNAFIEGYTEAGYRHLIQSIEQALNHYLRTGQMLKDVHP